MRPGLPVPGGSRDGPLFVARQMEDKWDVYLYDGHLYFARSWTGDLVYRAAVEFRGDEAVVTGVEVGRARAGDDPGLAVRAVDFLLKSHVHGREAPHPLPRGLPEDTRALAVYSFGEYGRWAWYGSFEDTTRVRVSRGE